MNDREWPLFAAEIEATFRGGLEDDRELALREHFGRVDFDLARAVIARLVETGQVFVPTAGELVRALRHVTGGGDYGLRTALAGGDDGGFRLVEGGGHGSDLSRR